MDKDGKSETTAQRKRGRGGALFSPENSASHILCFRSAWSLRAGREIAPLLDYLLGSRGCRLHISL